MAVCRVCRQSKAVYEFPETSAGESHICIRCGEAAAHSLVETLSQPTLAQAYRADRRATRASRERELQTQSDHPGELAQLFQDLRVLPRGRQQSFPFSNRTNVQLLAEELGALVATVNGSLSSGSDELVLLRRGTWVGRGFQATSFVIGWGKDVRSLLYHPDYQR